jgi:GT2 family glycosyltransferase
MSKYLTLVRLAIQHFKTNGVRSLIKVIVRKLVKFSSGSIPAESHTLDYEILSSHWRQEFQESSSEIPRLFTVIIPVFNGMEHIVKLRKSIGNHTYDILIIDDCSTDKNVSDYLLDWSSEPNVKLIRNINNLGFTHSVNIGIRKVKNDFILLNSDTIVNGDWAKRLLECLYKKPETAAVSPFSNSATIFSWPSEHGQSISSSQIEIDAAASRISANVKLTAPTINGFCVAIKYSAWEEVGEFDETVFGIGYGEENDWSIRARKLGYTVELAPSVYVGHFHGGSFAAEVKKSRLKDSWADLNRMYPKYRQEIASHRTSDPWSQIRRSLEVIVALNQKRNINIYISHGAGGGADVWLYQEIAKNSKAGFTSVVVLPGKGHLINMALHYTLDDAERIIVVTNVPRDKFNSIFDSASVNGIVISNLVNWMEPFNFIHKIKSLAPLTFVVHDYYAICPSYNLLNSSNEFCGVPENLDICTKCLKHNYLVHQDFSSTSIMNWREKFRILFDDTEVKIKFFSKDSLSWFSRTFDTSKMKYEIVKPNYQILNFSENSLEKKGRKKRWQIAFIGSFSLAKGAEIAREIVEIASESFPQIEFHMIGEFNGKHPKTNNIEFHGSYNRSDLISIIAKHEIDIVVIPSIWPETYNIVTDEVVSSGVQVIVSPLGAMRERFHSNPLVHVSPELSPQGFLQVIQKLASK